MLLSRVIYFKALEYIHTNKHTNIQIHTHTPMQKPKRMIFRHHFCFSDEQTETGINQFA